MFTLIEHPNSKKKRKSRFFGISGASNPLGDDNKDDNCASVSINNNFLNTSDDNQTIFQFDEKFGQTSSQDNDQTSHEKSYSPPMGRLRREMPKPITAETKVEFPGIFVEGFRSGHLKFNIPGILKDSLKPTDSMEVKINLPTPDFCSESTTYDPSPSVNFMQGRYADHYRESSETNTTGNFGRFGARLLLQDTEQSTQMVTNNNNNYNNNNNNNNNNNMNAMPYSSIYFNPNQNYQGRGEPYLLNSTDTNQSDAHLLHYGTESYTVSSNPYSSSRFPSVYEVISTDSGLPSNCLVHSVMPGHRKTGNDDDNDNNNNNKGGGYSRITGYTQHNQNNSKSTNKYSPFGHFDL
ncbi:unnamed protein product [Heterobilharzia americana]|nr:unnamed protein product [Heterobilharzia americana]